MLRGGLLGGLAFMIFGPLANLALWAVAIQWYFPHKLPLTWGFKYWHEVFKPTSDAVAALGTSVLIASVTVNIARLFYTIELNGTIAGVVLVHAVHGLVIAVWIAAAAFATIDPELELAARNIGASALRTALTVTLPLAMPGLIASAIFVFLESLDEFTGTYFVGVPDVTTLPLVMFTASLAGNYQIAAITALVLLVPSVGFMLLIERFLRAEMLARVG